MQPNHATAIWDEFTARPTVRETGEDLESIQPSRPRREAREPALSAVLMQAIHLASTRRSRISQTERIREQTLLEVLTEAMRRAR